MKYSVIYKIISLVASHIEILKDLNIEITDGTIKERIEKIKNEFPTMILTDYDLYQINKMMVKNYGSEEEKIRYIP